MTNPTRALAAECLRVAATLVEGDDLLAARCVLSKVHGLLDDLAAREPTGMHGPVEIAVAVLDAPLPPPGPDRSRANVGRGEAAALLLAHAAEDL